MILVFLAIKGGKEHSSPFKAAKGCYPKYWCPKTQCRVSIPPSSVYFMVIFGVSSTVIIHGTNILDHPHLYLVHRSTGNPVSAPTHLIPEPQKTCWASPADPVSSSNSDKHPTWLWYCWWKKSCTTWDVWNLVNNGTSYLSTGAGFLPSTVLAICNSNNLPSRERVHIPPMGKANSSSPTAFGWDVSLREG